MLRKKIAQSSKYKLLLHKAYFDAGYGITGYFKYLIALFGISTLNVKATLIIGVVYAFCCYIIGWAWYSYGFMIASQEIGNNFNLFVKEMRSKIK